MKLNLKKMYKFAKIVAGKYGRENLKHILIKPGKIVATNGFCLLEIDSANDNDENQLLDFSEFSEVYKNKDYEVDISTKNETDDLRFPDYELIMPNTDPIVSASFNANNLITVLEQFKDKEGSVVTLELRSESTPILLKGIGMTGLVMPLNIKKK